MLSSIALSDAASETLDSDSRSKGINESNADIHSQTSRNTTQRKKSHAWPGPHPVYPLRRETGFKKMSKFPTRKPIAPRNGTGLAWFVVCAEESHDQDQAFKSTSHLGSPSLSTNFRPCLFFRCLLNSHLVP